VDTLTKARAAAARKKGKVFMREEYHSRKLASVRER
jgi:hypothetical protein